MTRWRGTPIGLCGCCSPLVEMIPHKSATRPRLEGPEGLIGNSPVRQGRVGAVVRVRGPKDRQAHRPPTSTQEGNARKKLRRSVRETV